MKKKYITAKEFDEMFDAGEDISEYLNPDDAKRPDIKQKRINLNLPSWMLNRIDREARKTGVNRQFIIKSWIAEKLKE